MALHRWGWDPWQHFDHLFGGLLGSPRGDGGRDFPRVNLYEDADGVTLTAELPGVKAGDVDVSVESGTVTLKGERKAVEVEGTRHRREIATGRFERSFTLPYPIDADAVEARAEDGLLTVRLPKAASARTRRIAVKASK